MKLSCPLKVRKMIRATPIFGWRSPLAGTYCIYCTYMYKQCISFFYTIHFRKAKGNMQSVKSSWSEFISHWSEIHKLESDCFSRVTAFDTSSFLFAESVVLLLKGKINNFYLLSQAIYIFDTTFTNPWVKHSVIECSVRLTVDSYCSFFDLPSWTDHVYVKINCTPLTDWRFCSLSFSPSLFQRCPG